MRLEGAIAVPQQNAYRVKQACRYEIELPITVEISGRQRGRLRSCRIVDMRLELSRPHEHRPHQQIRCHCERIFRHKSSLGKNDDPGWKIMTAARVFASDGALNGRRPAHSL